MGNRYPTFETVNFYAGGQLNRASWLRESSAYLNQALMRPDARILPLSNGNPLIRREDSSHRIAWFPWKEVADAVMQTVHRFSPSATTVFGPTTYMLEKKPDMEDKYWARSTQGILAPFLSLAFLGILEEANTLPETIDFKDTGGKAMVVPKGAPCFALSLSYRPSDLPATEKLPCEKLLEDLTSPDSPYQTLDMRTVILSGAMDREDAAVLANARTLLDWNDRYKFCAGCGSLEYSVWGGHKRGCASVLAKITKDQQPLVKALYSGAEVEQLCDSVTSVQNYSYPRSDPVIIVGILSADCEHILLGRQKTWPKGFYSCIAGFVEAGESLEEAVRREALEETGVRIGQVAYHSSQPWPFPANLIFGAFGIADTTRSEIRLDLDVELEDAFFAPRADVLAAVEAAEQRNQKTKNESPTRNGHRYLYVQY
ncbi:NAD(+) diphosphatase [Malassezia yamatoensis]|uniref:NAD(+) diphosphatase n=1 Tax=Malassezia yamatoensis TaxID=253288 RepID=A0AAJ6CIH1_9BASI|nr:NAD(+) diphosphatase [Malassezia yamatoensis]